MTRSTSRRSSSRHAGHRRFLLPLLLLPLLLLAALGWAQPANAAVTLTDVGSFDTPIYVTAPPGDGERLVVAVRDGTIRVVKNGSTLAAPFLTIPDVDTSGDEGGLLGMAFAPDYLTSGRFYVFMVPEDADPTVFPHGPAEIREYRRSAANPDLADPESKRTVLAVPHPDSTRHYGGTLQFGPDGLLYATVGDGGVGGAPARNTFSRLGKLLRLGPRPSGGNSYTVPPDNPYANGVGGDPLVWSYGLRNPFRFSFDRSTGDLILGDVGQNSFEEIDFAPSEPDGEGRGRGVDFGWNACEGLVTYPGGSQPCTTGTLPVHTYSNPADACASVTGGVVVRDPTLEELAGKYVYGDFCSGAIRSLQLALPTATGDAPVVSVPPVELVAIGEDACGRVYVVLINDDKVQRLEDGTSSCNLPPLTYLPPVEDPDETPPPGGAKGTATPATTAFAFDLAGALRQRPLRSRNVGVRVRCNATCSTRALGRLSIRVKGRRVRLRQGLARRTGAGTLTLRLRLSANGRRALRRALRRRTPVRAALTVRVRDGAGRLAQRRRTVRLVR